MRVCGQRFAVGIPNSLEPLPNPLMTVDIILIGNSFGGVVMFGDDDDEVLSLVIFW